MKKFHFRFIFKWVCKYNHKNNYYLINRGSVNIKRHRKLNSYEDSHLNTHKIWKSFINEGKKII